MQYAGQQSKRKFRTRSFVFSFLLSNVFFILPFVSLSLAAHSGILHSRIILSVFLLPADFAASLYGRRAFPQTTFLNPRCIAFFSPHKLFFAEIEAESGRQTRNQSCSFSCFLSLSLSLSLIYEISLMCPPLSPF